MAIEYGFSAGTIRNQPINAELEAVLMAAAQATGVGVRIFSGGQPSEGENRTGSHRHDEGGAADLELIAPDGHVLDENNPQDLRLMQEFIRVSVANGATGIGAGAGYMGSTKLHIGFGEPAVWGAGGRGANAPAWATQAYNAGMANQTLPTPPANVGGGQIATAANLIGPGGNYTVQRGENLTQIAQRFGTTPEELARLNGIANPNLIYEGQTLSVGQGQPQSVPYSGNAPVPSPTPRPRLLETLAQFREARAKGMNVVEAFRTVTGRGSQQISGPNANAKPLTYKGGPSAFAMNEPASAPRPNLNLRPEVPLPTPRPSPPMLASGNVLEQLGGMPKASFASGASAPPVMGNVLGQLGGMPQQPLDPSSLYNMSIAELSDIIRNRDLTPDELRMVSEVLDLRRQREEANVAANASLINPPRQTGNVLAELGGMPQKTTPTYTPDPSIPFATGKVKSPGGSIPLTAQQQSSAQQFAMTGRPSAVESPPLIMSIQVDPETLFPPVTTKPKKVNQKLFGGATA